MGNIIGQYIDTFFQQFDPIIDPGPPPGPTGEVAYVSLINATTDAVIAQRVENDDEIDITTGTPISLKAEVGSGVASVVWYVDGVKINISNAVHKILPDRKYTTPGYTVLTQTRPFNYGQGVKKLTLIPYSGLNGTGTAGPSFERTVEFNAGTSLGLSPVIRTAANLTQLQTAVTAANHDDTIRITATYSVLGYFPTLTKRLKFVGDNGVMLRYLRNWKVGAGIVWNNIDVETYPGASITVNGSSWLISGFGDAHCFDIQDGADGILIGNSDFSRCNIVLNSELGTDMLDEINGVVISDCTGQYFSGGRAAVADIKSKISNCMCWGNNFTWMVSSTRAMEGFKLGQDQHKYINTDICWVDNFMDVLDANENADREVHGVHAFASYLYIVGNTVKNVINKHARTDKEAFDGAGNYCYVAHNWCHNGGAQGQEGHFNFKDLMVGGLYEYNLVTDQNISATFPMFVAGNGQAFTLHGGLVARNNKAVLEFASNSNGGMFLLNMYDNQESDVHDNEYIGNGAKFARYNRDQVGFTGDLHVYNNIGNIKTLEQAGQFYKDSSSGGITLHEDGGDSMCPPTGTDGTACVPAGTDWYVTHVPTHEGNGWYP